MITQRRIVRLAATAALLVCAGSLTAGAAQAQSMSHTSVSSSSAANPAIVRAVIAKSGKVISLPANWQSLTPAELARYGLVPNISAPAGAAATSDPVSESASSQSIGGTRDTGVQPESAYRWNGQVFIGVTGSGLHIDEWYT